MYRPRDRRPPVSFWSAPRRPRFILELLESRRLLSAAGSSTTVTPAVATVTADIGFPPGPGGGSPVTVITNPTPVSTALTPSQIATAYSISQSATTGSSQTIAIVDAYNDPNIQSDLATFDSQYKLPAASLTVENELGQTANLPRTNPGWSLEIALDVEWAHAAAPGAKIVLVEANSASASDLMTAVQTAAKQASVVSMSWGGSEFAGETAYDTAAYFANPSVTFLAASGDNGGATGAEWPAASPYVVSVGGTTLSLTGSGSIVSETAWNGTGSVFTGFSGSTGGASRYEPAPSYQTSALGSSVTRRETPDVSAVANPSTGLSVYDSVPGEGQTGWFQVGGTSAGTPLWAGIVAAADQARVSAGGAALSSTQTLSMLYGMSTTPAYASNLHDITSGSNFVATAKPGYDMVTGLGSPVASNLIAVTATFGTTTSAVKTAVTTTITVATSTSTGTTTTHTTPQVQTPSATTTTTLATAGTSSVTIALSPSSTTTVTTAQPVAVPATLITASTATTGGTSALARPAQSLPAATPVRFGSETEEITVLPPAPAIPQGPGLFLEPDQVHDIGDVAPALASGIEVPAPVWDAALEGIGGMEGVGLSAPPVPEVELDTDELGIAGGAALAGLALALWSTSVRSEQAGSVKTWRPAAPREAGQGF
jgi:subtilase family serine protease